MEFTLEQGDVLYMPRGVIHQAHTDNKVFSTHVTISVYQRQSWSNFMELAMPRIIHRAFANDVEFRRGVPPQYLNFLGSQYSGSTQSVKDFCNTLKQLVSKLSENLEIQDLQHAADLASLDFITHRLPPPDTPESSQETDFSLDGMVFRLRNREYIRIVISSNTEDDHVSLLCSTANCRQHHMGICTCGSADNESVSESLDSLDQDTSVDEPINQGVEPKCIGFSKNLSLPLIKLYDAFPQFVKLEKLCVAASDEISVRGMLLQLWSSKLLELQEENSARERESSRSS
uniref:Bifunctional lysine-specific demethylase and histidyl-hydroxylase n=1 Tax=Albugo laibachii Nc14 TaxID=890382 RepID=F0WG93_9STRA|nr:nucleolar protein putative [Albugo laibachii Nc14]|eukprot:CCA20228.1 nucleolar protein putative [Albugo laibachii Nc14]